MSACPSTTPTAPLATSRPTSRAAHPGPRPGPVVLAALAALAALAGCGGDDGATGPEAPAPTIASVSPARGRWSTPIELRGNGFGTVAADVDARVGDSRARVVSVTDTRLVVVCDLDATSCDRAGWAAGATPAAGGDRPITVRVRGGAAATAATPFRLLTARNFLDGEWGSQAAAQQGTPSQFRFAPGGAAALMTTRTPGTPALVPGDTLFRAVTHAGDGLWRGDNRLAGAGYTPMTLRIVADDTLELVRPALTLAPSRQVRVGP